LLLVVIGCSVVVRIIALLLGDDDDNDDDDDDDDDDDVTTPVDVEDKGFIADEANEHNASHVVSNRAAAADADATAACCCCCCSNSTAICLFIVVVVVVVVASFSCSACDALLEMLLSVFSLLGLGEEEEEQFLLSLDFKCDNILWQIDCGDLFVVVVVVVFCLY
jgi:hypothetical protein